MCFRKQARRTYYSSDHQSNYKPHGGVKARIQKYVGIPSHKTWLCLLLLEYTLCEHWEEQGKEELKAKLGTPDDASWGKADRNARTDVKVVY